jgi:hypothetical protein
MTTWTQNLHNGGPKLPVHFSSGSVLRFKSTLLDLSVPGVQESNLYLYNDNGDITLRIILRGGQNKIFCNDYASGCLFGWGQERSFDLGSDFNRWPNPGATISVYSSWTDSKLTRYQILVNLTTVCYFDSRFRGPVEWVSYLEPPAALRSDILSNPLRVVCCAISDLQPEERRAIQSGRQVDISQCSFIAHES